MHPRENQARFYVGAGGNPPNLSLAPPKKNICLQQQYAVVKPANSYTGDVFWRVGVVDLAVLACVLRATTKKGRQFFCLAPQYPIFSSRTAPGENPGYAYAPSVISPQAIVLFIH